MPEREVTIMSSVGLHARPAARFVKAAAGAGGPVTIRKGTGDPVDAASILAVLSLNVACGENVVVSAPDDALLDDLAGLLAKGDDPA